MFRSAYTTASKLASSPYTPVAVVVVGLALVILVLVLVLMGLSSDTRIALL